MFGSSYKEGTVHGHKINNHYDRDMIASRDESHSIKQSYHLVHFTENLLTYTQLTPHKVSNKTHSNLAVSM